MRIHGLILLTVSSFLISSNVIAQNEVDHCPHPANIRINKVHESKGVKAYQLWGVNDRGVYFYAPTVHEWTTPYLLLDKESSFDENKRLLKCVYSTNQGKNIALFNNTPI